VGSPPMISLYRARPHPATRHTAPSVTPLLTASAATVRWTPTAPGRRWCRARAALPLMLLPVIAAGCGGDTSSWAGRNSRLVETHKLAGRTRELPPLSVPTVLADGEPVDRGSLPTITIAPGVTATLGWGRGALVERIEMRPDATYPAQTLA